MNVVILAAGMGKRMHSKLPKVLQPLAKKPMLDWVIETTQSLTQKPIVVVVGHQAEMVKQHYEGKSGLVFALQREQKGTGDALRSALEHLDEDESHTLVCLGDVPLLSRQTIDDLCKATQPSQMGLLTVTMSNPTGYGRIVRNQQGAVIAIVEEKDASPDEKAINEVNTGIMLLPTKSLRPWLTSLTNHNAQGEYYLTDCIAKAVEAGVEIVTVSPHHAYEVEGVNSKTQLAALERVWQRSQADQLLASGVTLMDPDRIFAARFPAGRTW